jgi:hypothetical protein
MENINNQEQKNEKVADNIISERKQQIYQIEDRIDSEKNKLNKISDIEDNFIALNKSLNRCIELVSSSVKSKKNTYMYEDMHISNNTLLNRVSNTLDEERDAVNKNIKNLYSEKSKIEDETKEKE